MAQNNKKTYIIACGVLKPEMQKTAQTLGINADFNFLESTLHDTPEKLKSELQLAINAVSPEQYDRIILGYGICGQGTDGITAGKVPLIIPQIHDCISLFLGSAAIYKEQFESCPGTYYFTPGWLDKGSGPDDIRKWMMQSCPGHSEKEIVELIEEFFSGWQKNYTRAVFVNTGSERAEECRKLAQTTAEKHGWKYEEMAGSTKFFEKLLIAEKTDDEILLVPPGFKIIFNAVSSKLEALPITI
ncbi:MAG: DUF1638 domain-containing protein [Sedimentisphaerales bacterium]